MFYLHKDNCPRVPETMRDQASPCLPAVRLGILPQFIALLLKSRKASFGERLLFSFRFSCSSFFFPFCSFFLFFHFFLLLFILLLLPPLFPFLFFFSFFMFSSSFSFSFSSPCSVSFFSCVENLRIETITKESRLP